MDATMGIPATINASKLLLFTAVVESNAGTYLKQIYGPAMGVYQMEPATFNDIFKNYLKSKPKYLEVIQTVFPGCDEKIDVTEDNTLHPLVTDLMFQTVMARIHYRRDRYSLPDWKDEEALWEYYKRVWNTYEGKAEKEECLRKWREYTDG